MAKETDIHKKKDELTTARRASQDSFSESMSAFVKSLEGHIGSSYIVEKEWGRGELPIYRELHKITAVRVVSNVALFISDVTIMDNTAGYISIISKSSVVAPSDYEKESCTAIKYSDYDQILKYYHLTVNNMFRNLDSIITDQLIFTKKARAIKHGELI
jgi:hypothetical protein